MDVLTRVNSWPEMAAMLQPCPECGEPFGVLGVPKASEQRDCVELHNEIVNSGDAIRMKAHAAIMAMQYPCNSCIAKDDEARKRDAEKNHVSRARAWSYTKGCIPEIAKAQTFKASRRDVEALNLEAWETLVGWKRECNLWLCGMKGVGKTYSAHCLMNREMELGRRCAEVSAFTMVTDAGRFDVRDRVAYAVDAEVVLVDDIDKAQWTEKSLELLWWLIDLRNKAGFRTLFTANWERKTLSDAWCKKMNNHALVLSLFDRLLPCERVFFAGQSVRLEQQQELLRETV